MLQLQRWEDQQQLQGGVLQGVQQALAHGQAPELDAWLLKRGIATEAQTRRVVAWLWRQLAVEELNSVCKRINHGGSDAWLQALQQRLDHLGVGS